MDKRLIKHPESEQTRTYTVGQVEEMTGVTRAMLRDYEKKGLLVPARTGEYVSNNRRLYTDDDIERLKRIVVLLCYKLSLSEIKQVLDEDDVTIFGVLEAKLDDLRREQNRIRNLILFAKYVTITETDLFEGLACGPEDIDAFADMVRATPLYREAIERFQNTTDEDLESMAAELYEIVDDFVMMDEIEGFRGVELFVDRYCDWWDRAVCSISKAGFLGFWAIFEDSPVLAFVVEELGNESTSGDLQMSAFFVYMKRLMLQTQDLLKQIADASNTDVLEALGHVDALVADFLTAMGVAKDEPQMGLSLSLLRYMQEILDDEELRAYIDPIGQIILDEETIQKVVRVMELARTEVKEDES